MKKITLIIILFLLSVLTTKAVFIWHMSVRDYRTMAVDTSFLNGSYQLSLQLALENFDLIPHDTDYNKMAMAYTKQYRYVMNHAYGNIIRAYAYTKQYDSAIIWFDSLLKIYDPPFSFYFSPNFIPLQKDSRFSKHYEPILEAHKKTISTFEPDYFRLLLTMRERDQEVQVILFDYQQALDSMVYQKYQSDLKAIGEYNINTLDSLIDLYGYPNFENVLEEGVRAAWLIMQHAGVYKLPDYYDFVMQSYQNGTISASSHSMFIDRYLVFQNCPQRFGTQGWKDEKDNKYYLYPLENEENINAIRNKIGLGSIEEVLNFFKMDTLITKQSDNSY